MKKLIAILTIFFSLNVTADIWDITHLSKTGNKITVEKGLMRGDYRIYLLKGNEAIVTPAQVKEDNSNYIVLEATFPKMQNPTQIYLAKNSNEKYISRIYSEDNGTQVVLAEAKVGFYKLIGKVDLNKNYMIDIEKFTDFMGNISYRVIYHNFRGEGKVYPLVYLINDNQTLRLEIPKRFNMDLKVDMPKNTGEGWKVFYNGESYEIKNIIIL